MVEKIRKEIFEIVIQLNPTQRILLPLANFWREYGESSQPRKGLSTLLEVREEHLGKKGMDPFFFEKFFPDFLSGRLIDLILLIEDLAKPIDENQNKTVVVVNSLEAVRLFGYYEKTRFFSISADAEQNRGWQLSFTDVIKPGMLILAFSRVQL